MSCESNIYFGSQTLFLKSTWECPQSSIPTPPSTRLRVHNINVVCLGDIRPTWEFFSLIWRCHMPVKGCKFWPLSALTAFKQWGFFRESTVTQDIRLKCSFPRTRDTHTCCRAFNSGAVTTRFNDLGL